MGGGKDRHHLPRDRVIVHIDVDYFAVQIHLRYKPELQDLPCIAIQKLNQENRNPRIVSVNTIAKRQFGITRNDRYRDARRKCDHLICFEEEFKYNKTWDRMNVEASDQILDVIKRFCKREDKEKTIIIERDSADGFFLDITHLCKRIENRPFDDSSWITKLVVEGKTDKFLLSNYNGMNRLPLTYGGIFINDLCDEILKKTGFQTSAGISYNRLLTKIGCDLNKPNTKTIIHSKPGLSRVYKELDINQIPGLKKGFGADVMDYLGISKAIQMRNFRRSVLEGVFGLTKGSELWDIARGLDRAPVVPKTMNKSVSSGRLFMKGMTLHNEDDIDFELEVMSFFDKLEYDLKRNKRLPQHIRIEFFMDRRLKCKRSGNIPLEFRRKYDFVEIYGKILSEAQNTIGNRTYYKSNFTANEFKKIEEKSVNFCCALFARSVSIQESESPPPKRAIQPPRPPEMTTEERYQKFMAKNRNRLYVNSEDDYESDFN